MSYYVPPRSAARPIRTSSIGLTALVTGLMAGSTLATAQEISDDLTLDTIVVTGSGTPTDLINAPASITVIDAEEIAESPAQDVRDLLRSVPGVTINHSGNQDKVQIRGLGERYTLFLIDGKRVTSAPNVFRGNDYDSGWVPIEAIERIEVVRGPMSSLYGSDAIGGVVNIITKKETAEWHGSLTTEVTVQENQKSGNYSRLGYSVSGPVIKDKLFFRSYGSWDYRQADEAGLNPGTQRNGDPLDGFYESDDKFIDNTLTWVIDPANELDVNYGYSNRLQDLTTLERHAFGLTHRGTYDFGQTEFRVYGDQVKNDYGHGNRAEEMQPNTAYNVNADGKVNTYFDMVVPHELTVGASYKYQEIEDEFVLTGAGGDSSSVWETALFLEDTMSITERFDMTFGARLDNHEHFGWNASPRAYGVYSLTDNWTIKGGWSTSFKAPTLLENSPNWNQISCGGGCYMIGSKDLDPETSNSFELGVNYESSMFSANITGFHNDIEDMIPFPPARTDDPVIAPTYANFVGFDSRGNSIFTYENIDQARTMGIEASIAVRPRDDLTITANYTYLDAKATSGIERPLAYAPEHSANVSLDWQATEKLSLGAAVNYFGDQYTYVPTNGNMSGASKSDAYVTADLTGQYDVNDSFTIRAGILNVADKQILRHVDDDFNVDGRRFFFGATARF